VSTIDSCRNGGGACVMKEVAVLTVRTTRLLLVQGFLPKQASTRACRQWTPSIMTLLTLGDYALRLHVILDVILVRVIRQTRHGGIHLNAVVE